MWITLFTVIIGGAAVLIAWIQQGIMSTQRDIMDEQTALMNRQLRLMEKQDEIISAQLAKVVSLVC
jgi:hypothetical protein